MPHSETGLDLKLLHSTKHKTASCAVLTANNAKDANQLRKKSPFKNKNYLNFRPMAEGHRLEDMLKTT